MHKLRISVLSDNVAGRWCRAEHGLSFLIEADQKILFDTGSSDLIQYNAQILNVDLSSIDAIVISHGHDDHTGGLKFLERSKLVCHPEIFTERYRKSNRTSLGIPFTETEIRSKFDVLTSREPMRLSDQVWFLGEIPRKTSFESRKTAFVKADGSEDFVTDDSGLAIVTRKGLVVVSGCAHSGICNMTSHAQKVSGVDRIHMVVGGFHLQNDDELTQRTIDWMIANNVEHLVPSHCTGFAAQAAISKSFRFIPVKSGNVIDVV